MHKYFIRNGQAIRRKPQLRPIPFDEALRQKFLHARPQLSAILCLDPGQIDALKLAQSQEQFFLQRLLSCDALQLLDGKTTLQDCRGKRSRIMRIGPALRTVERMRARAKTEVGFALPIFQVVA